jgi:hypothetical protein
MTFPIFSAGELLTYLGLKENTPAKNIRLLEYNTCSHATSNNFQTSRNISSYRSSKEDRQRKGGYP